MSKEAKLVKLAEKRNAILSAGGEAKIAEQHNNGKMTARERIEALLDDGSFIEMDQFVSHRSIEFDMPDIDIPGEGVVTGYGSVDGRLVYIYSQDFTVLGGSLGEMHAKKICKVMDMALSAGAPIIGISDSAGARMQEGIDALNGYAEIYRRSVLASGVIPQISAVMGPCQGGAAILPALSDFTFIVNGADMSLVAPSVVKAVSGQDVSAEDLGGAMTSNEKSASAQFYAVSEADCLTQIKRLLSFLPNNNIEGIPMYECSDPAERTSALLDLLPEDMAQAYDMHDIITNIADNQDFMEVQPYFATNMLTGFIRLNGISIGVVANQPTSLAGCLNIDSSDKASSFVRFCDSMGIPLVTFVDSPGYVPAIEEAEGGIIRHAAKLVYAYAEATVPKLVVVVRKAYGGAYLAMCSKALGADTVIAWPTAQVTVMDSLGAANILYRKEIDEAADPHAMRDEKVALYEEAYCDPYHAAGRGLVDVIIEPEYSRFYLIKSIDALLNKKESRPGKKHGNFPC